MFFRTKQIKGTPLLQLVEAYRNTEGQPRQRVVASLGNATLPAGDPRRLAKAVEEQINGQTELLDEAVFPQVASNCCPIAPKTNKLKFGKSLTPRTPKAYSYSAAAPSAGSKKSP